MPAAARCRPRFVSSKAIAGQTILDAGERGALLLKALQAPQGILAYSLFLGCAGLAMRRDSAVAMDDGEVSCSFQPTSKGWRMKADNTTAVRESAGDLLSNEAAGSGLLTWTLHVSGVSRVLVGAVRADDGLRIWGTWVPVPAEGRYVRVQCDLDSLKLTVLEGGSGKSLAELKEGRLVHEGLARLSVFGAPGTTVKLVSTPFGAAPTPPPMPVVEDSSGGVAQWMAQASKWKDQVQSGKAKAAKEADKMQAELEASEKREMLLQAEIDRYKLEAEQAKQKRKAAEKMVGQARTERDQSVEQAQVQGSGASQQMEDLRKQMDDLKKAADLAKAEAAALEKREAQVKADRTKAFKEQERMKASLDASVRKEEAMKLEREAIERKLKKEREEAADELRKASKREEVLANAKNEALKGKAEGAKDADRGRDEIKSALQKVAAAKLERDAAVRDAEQARAERDAVVKEQELMRSDIDRVNEIKREKEQAENQRVAAVKQAENEAREVKKMRLEQREAIADRDKARKAREEAEKKMEKFKEQKEAGDASFQALRDQVKGRDQMAAQREEKLKRQHDEMVVERDSMRGQRDAELKKIQQIRQLLEADKDGKAEKGWFK